MYIRRPSSAELLDSPSEAELHSNPDSRPLQLVTPPLPPRQDFTVEETQLGHSTKPHKGKRVELQIQDEFGFLSCDLRTVCRLLRLPRTRVRRGSTPRGGGGGGSQSPPPPTRPRPAPYRFQREAPLSVLVGSNVDNCGAADGSPAHES